ncbi:16S rRNA (cytosine967-C5)-methyltransferase [Cohnella sp. SGD-V74]|uniref:16S rRNA (cytosine(967)-C(5))-methyltransferase RsmB n=1 Tax=unclassified Cohnella TaxID=2636738 RepID=UPI000D48B811|nr:MULTISPECIES: 16S rRNA (cytosine(967)-C(5))-methyltransferase RsmB [unclassified Cohnella]PRX74545.1 16S rRNA (cytosine967-C5)-methyltransferase [Cohnella sp. SGD-V74]
MTKTIRLPGGKPQGAREVAMSVLHNVETRGAYSGLELNQAIQAAGLSRPDAALATELAYGTIQRLNTIDHALQSRVKGWPKKIEPWVRALLRMSYYQLRWLTRVPAHAVVDEAVGIAKKRGHAGIGGLVNGVLRAVLREGFAAPLPQGLTPAERIALEHSHPLWLVERWLAEFGEAAAERMCAANNEPPHVSARINPLKTTRERVLAEMADAGIEAAPSRLAPEGIIASRTGNLVHSEWYKQGSLTVQDESSMLVASVADPRPGMRVLDCCAAPGGKTTHLAEKMRDEGTIVANDVHPHKEALIKQQAERLNLTAVRTMTADALELADKLEPESFDVVLLDAPCSGLGVIRRKPEIKWNKSEADIGSLSELQSRLLDRVQALVKPGGTLVYSTCTIAPEENENAVRLFLQRHPAFSLEPEGWTEETLGPLREAGVATEPFEGMLQLLPDMFGSDGFFIARLRKQNG